MKKGKLIVIEGTDCSGKETQSKKLVEELNNQDYKVFHFGFPQYDSPTGKIIGGPYLGKKSICDGWFSEGAPNVDPLVACSYYAADRRYHIDTIMNHLNNGETVILDRYVESNMAHQGAKIKEKNNRIKLWEKLDKLEFDIMELPRPDAVILLYMPYEYASILKKARKDTDEHESSIEHLKKAEETYLELTDIYGFLKIECVENDAIRSIDDIHKDVIESVKKIIDNEN